MLLSLAVPPVVSCFQLIQLESNIVEGRILFLLKLKATKVENSGWNFMLMSEFSPIISSMFPALFWQT
jgi:hypothetical protein